MGEGSALSVGVPVPWPVATAPVGWLKCNGAAFTASQYPKLALAYPALKLPDLRGEFIRGWDDGRGVDTNRAIGQWQGDALQDHTHQYYTIYPGGDNDRGSQSSVFSIDDATWGTTAGVNAARASSETRPRNIAFNYIVRAA
ncbi:Tail Collar domain protein [[Enterobacter] lignolyticus SCF1]|uniref:Tail Collar domain protein n=1 Tax=Enterobacter lignolyticus (strain SCF1) TaxID=701347 RepID=E3G769_ENTLS|nr:Tail Collar domain protein [[Enterobacter] lignolyticus SCF1]